MPSQTPDQSPAHPRVGGENDWTDPKAPLMPGSSPRGRGKQPLDLMRYLIRRLIPAWAGKTLADNWEVLEAEAHPRVGGENLSEDDSGFWRLGSSPRGRGKPRARAARCSRRGLIPAWAGKTWDVGTVPDRQGGSSPRGRGKLCEGVG